jgi:hypothetical protein
MSTELKSTTQDVTLTRFWAGLEQKVQVTAPRPSNLGPVTSADKFFSSMSLTRDEARTLALDLFRFAESQEAVRFEAEEM